MRLASITSRYWPESSPGAKRAYALAGSLRSAGHGVTVLTQMPNYPDPSAFEYERKGRTQVEVDPAGNTTWRFVPRVASKDDLVRRLAWEARFAALASGARRSLPNLDGVIASVPFVFNVVAARTFGLPMWLDLRDLTWEYARAVGKSPIQRAGVRALRSIALSGFRAALGVSTTSSAQRRYLIDQGVPASRVHLVPNGVPEGLLEDLARRSAAGATASNGCVRVVYAGLLGYPQGLGLAVDAVEDMASGVELHLYGDGVDRPALAARCRSSGLRQVTVHGHVPHDGYLDAITSADILFASLRPEAESAMPSKILEYMAAARPVVFAGQGEAAEVVREAGAGLVVPYGDRRGLSDRLHELASDPVARRQMGENGRRWVEQHRVRERVNEAWVRAIEDAIEGRLSTRGAMRPLKRVALAAAQGAERSGLVRLLERASGGKPDRLAILTYHRIADPESRPRPAPGTLSATPSEFADQMEFLARSYRVLGMRDLLDHIRKDRALPPGSALLTFDDAYHDFEEHAWPVLKRLGLPVTLFVPTGFPDQPSRVFWWDRLFQAIASTRAERVDTPLGPLRWSSFGDRVRSFRQLREVVKGMPHREAMGLLDRICEALGDGHPTPAVLGWDALRSLAREGVVLGSHTRSHPMMDRIAPEEAREEIVGSMEDLRREISPVASVPPILAYPAGRYDARVARVVAESNVELAFTTEPGVNELRRSDRLRLRRVHVGARTGLAGLRVQLLGLRQPE